MQTGGEAAVGASEAGGAPAWRLPATTAAGLGPTTGMQAPHYRQASPTCQNPVEHDQQRNSGRTVRSQILAARHRC